MISLEDNMKNRICMSILCVAFFLSSLCLAFFSYKAKDALAYDTHMVEIQSRLKELGYYNGAVNGVYDDATVVAIKEFQSDNGIYVNKENKCYQSFVKQVSDYYDFHGITKAFHPDLSDGNYKNYTPKRFTVIQMN